MATLNTMFFFNSILKSIPFSVIQLALNFSLKKMHKKYPRIFDKIAEQQDFSYLIVPTDLPFNFLLKITKNFPSLTVEKKTELITADATITATLANLLNMFQGNLDGDAAFFSRSLIIEGSTVAIVTLRNSVESESINILDDLTEDLFLFRNIVKKIILFGIKKNQKLNDYISQIEQALLQEANNNINLQAEEIQMLQEEIYKLKGDPKWN